MHVGEEDYEVLFNHSQSPCTYWEDYRAFLIVDEDETRESLPDFMNYNAFSNKLTVTRPE